MNDSTIYKKIAYYESVDYVTKMAELMIPDAAQYTRNIIFNVRQAQESKQIYQDITTQLNELRKEKNRMYNSFEYNIGRISVDGRTFTYRCFRDWCSCLHKIINSLFQLVNIVYSLSLSTKDVNYSNTVKKISDDNLKQLLDDLNDLLVVEIDIDNKSKHRLNAEIIVFFASNMNYKTNYILKDSVNKKLDELMDDKKEEKILTAVFDTLEYILSIANIMNYNHRAYVESSTDPEDNINRIVELTNDFDKNKTFILGRIIDKKDLSNESKACNLHINMDPPKTIYLASLYEYCSPIGISFNKVSSLEEYSIDVYKDGKQIGEYELDEKQDYGMHFYKYKLHNQ